MSCPGRYLTALYTELDNLFVYAPVSITVRHAHLFGDLISYRTVEKVAHERWWGRTNREKVCMAVHKTRAWLTLAHRHSLNNQCGL